MNRRNDFITHSGSGFMIARRPGMNDRQKAAVIQYVEKNLFGEVILTPKSTEDEIQKVFQECCELSDDEYRQQQVRAQLKEGKSIYTGWISFEECEYSYAKFFEKMWQIMQENDDHEAAVI